MKTIKEEFIKLLTAYQGIIHKVNLIYFKRTEDREDNFQEIAYHMWKAYPALKNKDKIASWIYSIAINTSISKIRKDSKYVVNDKMELNKDLTHSPENIEYGIDFEHLLDAITKLNEIDRSIMLLYLEEYSYNEIAEIIGISVSNTGTRISRAKKQLTKFLKL